MKPPRWLSEGDRRRFWAKVDVRGEEECWEWMGIKKNGYGMVGPRLTHRHAYTLLVGEIPEGLTLDHLCRNRACCNPAHLEPVTQRENILRGEGVAAINARKTHCKEGHPLTGENLRIVMPKGERRCVTCSRRRGREAMKRWREKDRLNGFNGQRGAARKPLADHDNGGHPQ